MTQEIMDKFAKIRQQKRDYYVRNRETIRQKQKIYQTISDAGKASIRKAKAQYFQSKIKKANGGCATEAHKRAKKKYHEKMRMLFVESI